MIGGDRSRWLDWGGCRNARDLGDLSVARGGRTSPGAIARADAVDSLSAEGWSALRAYGIRTIIDLRNRDERGSDAAPRPRELTTVHVPLEEDIDGTAFWERWGTGLELSTPLYYTPFLDSFPERTSAVIAAVAHAKPGGVLFHCVTGRDRAGLIALLLLALAGVMPEEIAADYGLSADRLGHVPEIDNLLRSKGTSADDAVLATLAELDVEAHLRRGGLGERELAAVRARLL